MNQPALYDDDILLWSEEQAEIIRNLSRVRNLPNALDIENIAEEVESVGRSELASVESYIELILSHLVKIHFNPQSEAVRHWRGEVISFHGNMKRRYTESMRRRIDLSETWRLAREQAITASEHPDQVASDLPAECPFEIDDFVADRLDATSLARRLVSAAAEQ